MSTGNLNLDIILGKIAEDTVSGKSHSLSALKDHFPSLSESDIQDLHAMFLSALSSTNENKTTLVTTAPPSFGIKAKSTMNTVADLLEHADSCILITGYSLSDYFNDLIDCIIQKSQRGVMVKFFVNQIESQKHFEKLYRYKGKFLKIYNL